ncbi:hypothetical protein VTO42DRAFT_4736 [Malbranchea cinnamomea]
MPRKQRAAAQAAARSLKATPQDIPDVSDEEMADVASTDSTSQDDNKSDDAGHETQQTQEGEGEGEGEAQADNEQAAETTETGTPAPDTEQASQQDTPRSGGRASALHPPRRRRPGRPPKNRPPDWEAPLDDERPSRAEVSTPVKRRGRGRPAGGGRWGRSKGGPSHVTQLPVDKDGNVMEVVDDEVVLPEDPEGETKVDKLGNLLGGREYRVRTFKILNRGDREYMLSTEPARCIGFRDSYLFFQKHRMLYKIIINDEEKRDLIERDIIPHSYKGRAIGVVTARSVFREFGAKIVIGGRKVIDDYYAQAARDRGDVEGELAVPEDKLPGPGETYDKNRYVAWHGASAVYHTGVPSVPMTPGKAVDSKKRRVVVTGDNWMVEHAREASRFNSSLVSSRLENLDGVYDIHTNIMMYPKIMQPTHARWEPVELPESDDSTRRRLLDSASSVLNRTDADGDTPMENTKDGSRNSTKKKGSDSSQLKPSTLSSTIFPPVPAIFSRNFSIHDIHYESAPDSTLGNPGLGGHMHDIGHNGLIELSDEGKPVFKMDADVLAELPPECRKAYIEAAAREWEWKTHWTGEAQDGMRAKLPLNYSWNP